MHWESFYINPKDVKEDELVFKEDEVKHISRVCRKKKGDIIWAVDGKGTAYNVQILQIGRKEIPGKIIKTRRLINEPVCDVTLAQGILKGERFDWLVEKATELGVRKIIPMISENYSTPVGSHKLARWKRVALAAMKQSARSVLPEITPVNNFNQVLSLGVKFNYRLIADNGKESKPLIIPKNVRPLVTPKAMLIIGSEGGFSNDEIKQSVEYGFQLIKLGPRRFRSETAGIVLLTILLSQLGELG